MSPIVATRLVVRSTARLNVGSALTSAASNSTALTSGLHATSSPSAPARFLSTKGLTSVDRFKEALEDYRTKNYTQTIPPRFRKEVTNVMRRTSTARSFSSFAEPAPISVEEQKKIAVEDIERFLQNIGALGDKVTHEDVETIVAELGESCEEIIRADLIVTRLLK
mmetsp:Transcript_15556/g.32198  ORF Transcript_15556/g.32198 Transcript_15556/m.32198 type:complete len:166 (+) Transcript_15556:102-599(+)